MNELLDLDDGDRRIFARTDAFLWHVQEENEWKRASDSAAERFGEPSTEARQGPVSGPFCTIVDRREWTHLSGCWWTGESLVDAWASDVQRWFDTEVV